MNKSDWILISGITSFLSHAEDFFNWSLSIGERASYLEILFEGFRELGFPDNIQQVQSLLKKANDYTYGSNSEYEESPREEIESLLEHCSDFFKEKHRFSYSQTNELIKNLK